MIFYLEIEGNLRPCLVREPFSSHMHALNKIRSSTKFGTEAHELSRDLLRKAARECVEAGEYELR